MALSPAALKMQQQVSSPLLFWFWLFTKLPAAWFCGVRMRDLNESKCVCTVPYGWRSQNPFRSTYFAAQAMAAEMSTGALVLLATADGAYSTLILEISGSFGKKADALATFTCEGGAAAFAAAAEARATGEPRTVTLETVGRLADGAEVSRFRFTWSIKARTPKA